MPASLKSQPVQEHVQERALLRIPWPGSLPPLLRTSYGVGGVLFACMCLGLALTPWITAPLLRGSAWIILPITLLVIACPAWTFLYRGRERRRCCELARSASYELCGHCGHSLREVTVMRCPECGVRVDHERLRRYWRRFTRHAGPLEPVPYMIKRVNTGVRLSFIPMLLLLAAMAVGGVAVSLFCLAMPFGWLADDWRDRRLTSKLIRNRFRLCEHCASEIHDDRCRRCGQQQDAEAVAGRWQAHFPLHWELEMGDTLAPSPIAEETAAATEG